MKRSPLRRGKPLTAKTGLRRTKANPAKKVAAHKPTLAKRILALNERAKAVMHRLFGWNCMCCHKWSKTCTIHHGMRRSQSWYHMFNPRNWHWICNKCHTLAKRQSALYLSMLDEVRPDLVRFMLDTRRKRQTCKKNAGSIETIANWMLWAECCQSYAELLEMPLWQEANDA